MSLLELTDVGMRKEYRMSLMISFVQKLKGWIERIDGDACSLVFPFFIIMLEGGAMHGTKWMSVGNE